MVGLTEVIMENYVKLDKNNCIPEDDENWNYKRKYYALIREISKVHGEMCEKCPFVKNCCGGCWLLKHKINQIKKRDKRGD